MVLLICRVWLDLYLLLLELIRYINNEAITPRISLEVSFEFSIFSIWWFC